MSARTAAAFCVFLLFAVPVHADDFTDFRIPKHWGRDWSVDVRGEGNRSSSIVTPITARSGFARSALAIAGGMFYDSDPIQWNARLRGAFEGSRRGSEDDNFIPFPASGPPLTTTANASRLTSRRTIETWEASGGARVYPWERPIGWEASGAIFGADQQFWTTTQSWNEASSSSGVVRSEQQFRDVFWGYQEQAIVELGAGYGRVRDASPIFAAILLEERLTRDGELLRPLSASARQRLAQLFSLRFAFGVPHQQPDKFFWREVQRLLEEDGAIAPDGLGAFAAMHANEDLPVLGSTFQRNVGWFVGPRVLGTHHHSIERDDATIGSRFYQDRVLSTEFLNTISNRTVRFSQDILIGGGAEYFRPLGTRTQLDLIEETLVSRRGDLNGLQMQTRAAVRHLVGERWLWDASAYHLRQHVREAHRFWSYGSSGSVTYFLEDFCSIRLGTDYRVTHFEKYGSVSGNALEKSLSASLGVTLGRGRLDAPGLVPPVRAMN